MNRLAMMVLKNILKVPGAWTKLCRYAKNPDNYPETETYAFIQYILNLAIKAGNVTIDVTGQENIPTEGGFVFYSNHQGMFDVLAIVVTCDMPLGAIFKKELQDLPFIKQIVSCTRSLAMDRNDVRQSLTVIQAVTKELQKGRSYLIFPEGTRSKNGNQMRDFHGGSFRCAVKAKAPIIPIALLDCYKVLDQKGSAPVTVQVHYLDPIPYEEYKDLKTVDLAELVRSRIQAAIDRYSTLLQ